MVASSARGRDPHAFRSTTRSHIGRTRQSMLPQRLAPLMRLPLQTSRPLWPQYRQIACWTNRGKVRGKTGLNCRASIRCATAAIKGVQVAVPSRPRLNSPLMRVHHPAGAAIAAQEGRKGVGRGSSTIIVNVNLLANLSSRTQFSLCSEVCSVNISRPETDVADWSVHDPLRKSGGPKCCDAQPRHFQQSCGRVQSSESRASDEAARVHYCFNEQIKAHRSSSGLEDPNGRRPGPLPVGLAGRIHRLDRLVSRPPSPPILASRAAL